MMMIMHHSRHNYPALPAISCAIIAIVLYSNTFDCGLCFDDVSAITNNEDLRPNTPWSALLFNDFWGTPMNQEGSHKSYRPLCVATFRLNYLFHELNPMGYHLVNILLHSVVCLGFVLICGLTVFAGNPVAQWVAGISFTLHPVHTEAVAGVVGRAESLSAIFFLACFYCYKKSVLADNATGWFRWLLASMTLCLFSVLSKEQGITVLAVCLCYEYFIVNKNTLKSSFEVLISIKKGITPPWIRTFLFNVVILIGFLAIIMVFRVKIMKAELPVFTMHDNPAVSLSTPYRQLHWLHLVFQNLWLLLTPSHLCADWTMGTIPLIQSVIDPRNLLTIATFTVIGVLGLYSVSGTGKHEQSVLFGLLLMVFPFIPASNLLFPVGFVVAERILYVPSMGYAILLATGLHKMISCNSKLLKLISQLGFLWLMLVHSAKTLERNRDWASAETLFQSAIHVNPRNGKVFNNLGHHFESLGNHSYAMELFRRAADVQPDDIGAFINLGRVLNVLNRPQESEEAYQWAIQLMPTGKTFRVAPSHLNVYFNMANLIKKDINRLEEAQQLYERVLSMKQDFTEAHMNLGDLYLKMNRMEDAKNSFKNAIMHRPDYSDAYFNLATTSLQLNEENEAETNYRKALQFDPNHALSLFNLGIMLSDRKTHSSLKEAMKIFNHLLLLQPNNDKAFFQLGIVHTELGELQEAMRAFQSALNITPTYRTALYNFGFLLYQTKETGKAFDVLLRLKEHYPDHSNGMQLLGDCYMHRNQIDKAIEAYSLCLKTNPAHVTAMHNLGVAMTKKERFSEAVDYFSQALKLNPNHVPSQKHLKSAKLELAKKNKIEPHDH